MSDRKRLSADKCPVCGGQITDAEGVEIEGDAGYQDATCENDHALRIRFDVDAILHVDAPTDEPGQTYFPGLWYDACVACGEPALLSVNTLCPVHESAELLRDTLQRLVSDPELDEAEGLQLAEAALRKGKSYP